MSPTDDNYLAPAADLSTPYPTGIKQPAGSSAGLLTYAGPAMAFLRSGSIVVRGPGCRTRKGNRPIRTMRRILTFLLSAAYLQAEVTVPHLFSDHMVLQSGEPVRIFGRARASESVSIAFQGQQVSTVADSTGNWQVFLRALRAGESGDLVISGDNRLTIHDVLCGEVWVAAGQSNMALTLSHSKDGARACAAADLPAVRFFRVRSVMGLKPAEDVAGDWTVCSSKSAAEYSAVAYYFARDLHRSRGVPVGIVQATWGGTKAEAWISREALDEDPGLRYAVDNYLKVLDAFPVEKKKWDPLVNEWKQASAEARKTGRQEPPAPSPTMAPGYKNNLSEIYNGMVYPLTRFTIRGIAWYQGESNAEKSGAYGYRRLFRALIGDWRRAWDEGPIPFLFVQLPNYRNQEFPLIREAQLQALDLRNTAMAVTIDVGNPEDIHPTEKETVGTRLTLAARALVYREDLEYSGPLFRSMAEEGNRVRVRFDHASSGLVARGGQLKGFSVAGPDLRFVPAVAEIDGESIVASSPDVVKPIAVRYGWDPNPACNLVNGAGLPASPFRSDTGIPERVAPAPITRSQVTVAQDSSGDFRTVQEAVDAVPSGNKQRVIIHIRPGIYRGRVLIPKDKPYLTFQGDDAAKTVITFFQPAMTSSGERSFGSTTVVWADGFEADNITFENTFGIGSQALAFYISADRAVFHNCRFLGGQDTLFAGGGRQYYKDCYIEGWVDFIYADATAVFDHCEIHSKGPGWLTAQSRKSTSGTNGYVFLNCRLTAEPGLEGQVYLGRPWTPAAQVVFMNTWVGSHIRPEGWHNWDRPEREKTVFYAEYRSTGPGADPKGRVAWSRQLNDTTAKHFFPEVFLKGSDGWDPRNQASR